MHRRRFFALAAAAAATPLILPEQRFWSLDRTMIPRNDRMLTNVQRFAWPGGITDIYEQDFIESPPQPGSMIWWAERQPPLTRVERITVHALEEFMRGVYRGQA